MTLPDSSRGEGIAIGGGHWHEAGGKEGHVLPKNSKALRPRLPAYTPSVYQLDWQQKGEGEGMYTAIAQALQSYFSIARGRGLCPSYAIPASHWCKYAYRWLRITDLSEVNLQKDLLLRN